MRRGYWGAGIAYLSPSGRIPRPAFVLRVLGPLVILGACLSIVAPTPSSTRSALFVVLLWAYLAGLAKRLQDFGLPGLPIASVLVLGLWLDLEMRYAFPAWLDTYVYALFGVGTLFGGSTTGERGANRYGPDPLAATSGDADG